MTQIHADLSRDAFVDTAVLPWDPSPARGVHRKRIERHGDEIARLTSIVRYAPGSEFPTHVHGGGEEYIVLSGTFSDEFGDHRAGTYVRNGVGTRHAPHTAVGCDILVRLWWMHPDETGSKVVPTDDGAPWRRAPCGRMLDLHQSDYETVELVEVDGGHALALEWDHGLELFVIRGTLNRLPSGSWLRRVGRGSQELTCDASARVLIRRGHLRNVPALPTST